MEGIDLSRFWKWSRFFTSTKPNKNIVTYAILMTCYFKSQDNRNIYFWNSYFSNRCNIYLFCL